MSSSSVNYELAAAIRRVNALDARIPERFRPSINGLAWRVLEDRIDRAINANDRPSALAAIDDWERHARQMLTSVLAQCPLEDAA